MYKLILTKAFVALSLTIANAQAPSWEAHLNIRGINGLLNGESGSVLIKAKLTDQIYTRLGLQGYMVTRKQTGASGNNILVKNFLLGLRPGIEKRTAINDRFFFIRGADLIYDFSGLDNIPPLVGQYKEKQRVHNLGASPFLGIHYTINSYLGILAESHLDAYAQFIRTVVSNDIASPQPNRIENRRDTLLEFRPFQNLTICFTF